ncbi:expressed protein, partial [Phakopsora pachyrhizi]
MIPVLNFSSYFQKWLPLLIMLLFDFMAETKCLDSITTNESISKVLRDARIPDYRFDNLKDAGLSKDLIKSTETQSNSQKLKFDLNELPGDFESKMSNS